MNHFDCEGMLGSMENCLLAALGYALLGGNCAFETCFFKGECRSCSGCSLLARVLFSKHFVFSAFCLYDEVGSDSSVFDLTGLQLKRMDFFALLYSIQKITLEVPLFYKGTSTFEVGRFLCRKFCL